MQITPRFSGFSEPYTILRSSVRAWPNPARTRSKPENRATPSFFSDRLPPVDRSQLSSLPLLQSPQNPNPSSNGGLPWRAPNPAGVAHLPHRMLGAPPHDLRLPPLRATADQHSRPSRFLQDPDPIKEVQGSAGFRPVSGEDGGDLEEGLAD